MSPLELFTFLMTEDWLQSLYWLLLVPCTAPRPPEIAPSLVFTYKLGFRVSGLPAVLALWVSPKLPSCAGWTREGPAITSSWVSAWGWEQTHPHPEVPGLTAFYVLLLWKEGLRGIVYRPGRSNKVCKHFCLLLNKSLCLLVHPFTLKKKKIYTLTHRKKWKEGFFSFRIIELKISWTPSTWPSTWAMQFFE